MRDRWTRWGPSLLVTGTLVVYFVSTRPASAPIGWGGDYDAALVEAKATDRNVVVAFHMRGCPPCYEMDRSVLGAPEVRTALERFVPLRLDVDEHRTHANRLDILGTPTYAVLDQQGRLLAKCEGYQPIERFLKFLARTSTPRPSGNAQAGAHPPPAP